MRRSRSSLIPATNTPVMSEINTTPLIDVMLVLLIMMILTVPITYHKVPVDLPQGRADGTPPPVHRITLDAQGGLSWDGAAISEAALPARLAALKADPALPVLHLKTDAETPYVRFDETVATIQRAGIERLGLVGNEKFAQAAR
jgi:biopolymer transport protein ExbD